MIRNLFRTLLFCTVLLVSVVSLADEAAITVNGDVITSDDYYYALPRYKDFQGRHFADCLDESSRINFRKEFIDHLIDSQLYIQEAVRRGITARAFAGEEEIEEVLGSTDESKAQRDRAEKMILAFKMRELLPPKVIYALKTEVSISDKEIVDEYLNRAEKMTVRYTKVDPFALANNMYVREDDVRDYYIKHPQKFMRSATKKYAILRFDPENYMDSVTIAPQTLIDQYKAYMNEYREGDQVKIKYALFRTKDYTGKVYDTNINAKKYYEDNTEKFFVPATARISLIFIKKPARKDVLAGLQDELEKNSDFSALARRYSDDPSAQSGGNLGYIKEGTLKEPFNGIAFNLGNDEASGIFETDTGYGVIKVMERQGEKLESFDEAQGEIESLLLSESAKPLAQTDAKRFKNEARKIGFDKAAEMMRVTPYETGYLKRQDIVPTLGVNDFFVNVVFGLSSNEVSDEIDYDNGYAVVKLLGKQIGEYKMFSDVSDEIKKALKMKKARDVAHDSANKAQNAIMYGTTFEDIARSTGARISYIEIPSTMEAPGETEQIGEDNGGYFISYFISEKKPDPAPYLSVSAEAAGMLALDKADAAALEKAKKILSGELTDEAEVVTRPFSRGDYLVGREYMRSFIEQAFKLDAGKAGIIKANGEYYVVKVLEKGGRMQEYKNDSDMIRSQVMMEKRDKYVKDWLKNEKEKAEIAVKI